jgi:hypothetical protein
VELKATPASGTKVICKEKEGWRKLDPEDKKIPNSPI